MLGLEDVAIRVGDFALQADFSLKAGSFCAVIGPSGAGKSTLLNAIAGFQPISSGRITWDGRRIDMAPPGARPLAMLFQDGNLFPHLTVAQNVSLGIRPNLRLTASERAEVNAALSQVGLGEFGARLPGTLSGGQQSRAALARILAQRRSLILLDEPFSALGPALKADMLDLVAQLAREMGATVLMITHDPEDARRVADQTLVVADGVAHAPGRTGPVLDNPPPALQSYLTTKR